jgi:hypothetical protein
MKIERTQLLEHLKDFALNGNGIIIGSPGVGKTYILIELIDYLKGLNIPSFLLPIDQLGNGTDKELQTELSYEGDLIEKLKKEIKISGQKKGILLFDAFDAARNESIRKNFLTIIQRAVQDLPGLWNVIVTVRTYDAKKSHELLSLFGVSSDSDLSNYSEANILCRHFKIPPLSENEVSQAFCQIPDLEMIYESASQEFKTILKIPFNLWLLEKILSSAKHPSDFSQISSIVQLLNIFWKLRVKVKYNRDDREYVLTNIARRMINEKSLSVRKENVYQPEIHDVWIELFSDEILVEASSMGQRISFSHNILFDYAISVLLIEDQPDKLISFITKDYSRPLFLRPSLTYYLTRLWYDSPDTFWSIFWEILPSSSGYLRMFAKILPTSVIVCETRKVEQLHPLINAISENQSNASEAILRLLQAMRALKIERDELWINILDKFADYIHRDFIWNLALMTSDILNRTKDEITKKICGSIARRILKWLWQQRNANKEDWLDKLCASWVIPLVADTYSTDPEASRLLLEKVLHMIKEPAFPIQFIYRITERINKILPHDPEFVNLVYASVFGHTETSQEKTNFGTPVMQFSSTRRQDYNMCQYHLIKYFPEFLRNAPILATRFVIKSLNTFVISKHVMGYMKKGVTLDDLVEEFEFRGEKAHCMSDSSHIWDAGTYKDQEIKMATDLFKYIIELASLSNKKAEFNAILDILRDEVYVAFIWKYLLKTTAEHVELFAQHLYKLCVARPIQAGPDTVYEVGLFIKNAASEFTKEQLREIEKTIIALPNSYGETRKYLMHYRDRLLMCIPQELLSTKEGRDIYEKIKNSGKILENRPLVRFKSKTEFYTEEKYLQDKGADIVSPENKELQSLYAPLEKFRSDWFNKVPSSEAIIDILSSAKQLLTVLEQKTEAHDAVVETAWTKIAACAETISRADIDPQSEEYEFCRDQLLFCAKHNSPKPNPEYDAQYSFPSWSPAPRTYAALGIPRLVSIKSDSELLKAIENLVHDKVPSVRYLVMGELYKIIDNTPDEFWKNVDDRADHELNWVVQKALCNSLANIISKEENQTVKTLEKLINNIFSTNDNKDLFDCLTYLLAWLVIIRQNTWALQVTNDFSEKPIQLRKPLKRITYYIFEYIKPHIIVSSENCKFADRGIDWLMKVTDSVACGVKSMRNIPEEEWNEESEKKLHDIYSIIDEIVMRAYLYADVNYALRDKGERAIPEEQRKAFYQKIKPVLEKILGFTVDREKGYLIPSTAQHFMELLNGVLKYDPKGVLHMAMQVVKSSEALGYHIDSMAIREVVNLVETMLTDYRSDVQNEESLNDLLNLLDVFTNTGWPEALQLVWRLDEIFR